MTDEKTNCTTVDILRLEALERIEAAAIVARDAWPGNELDDAMNALFSLLPEAT